MRIRKSNRSNLLRVLSVALACGLVLLPSVVLAHALLLRALPVQGSLVHVSPFRVHLWFTEDLNGKASRIVVWDRFRHDMTAGRAALLSGHPRELVAPLKPLHPGSFLVLWTSVSSEDGHILHGYYLFSYQVRGPGPSLAGVQTSTGDELPGLNTIGSILAHWLELLAAVSWGGIALTSLVAFRRYFGGGSRPDGFDQRWRSLVATVLGLLAASSLVVFALNLISVGDFSPSAVSDLLSSDFGRLWLIRQALVLLTLLLVLRLLSHAGLVAASFLSCLYLYLFAASGHAASANVGNVAGSHLVSAAIVMDWVHFLADSVWLGGQVAITLILISLFFRTNASGKDDGAFLDALDRFSPLAYAGVALLIVTGAFAGKIHIPSWYSYFHSVYGWTLTVKIALIGVMILISAYTTRVLRPRIRAGRADLIPRLRGWLGVNPLIGALVLLATSVMFYYPVPPGLAQPGPSVYTVTSSGLQATVRLQPDRSGPNQLTVEVRTPGGRHVTGAHVTVLTTMLDMVMGTGIVSMNESRPGVYRGVADMGMGGHWRLQILVYRPVGLTRMRLQVTVGT